MFAVLFRLAAEYGLFYCLKARFFICKDFLWTPCLIVPELPAFAEVQPDLAKSFARLGFISPL